MKLRNLRSLLRIFAMLCIPFIVAACGTLSPLIPLTGKSVPTHTAPTPNPRVMVMTAPPKPTAVPTADAGMGGMVMVTPSSGNIPMVKVSDQPLNNGMITIDEVVSSGPGWVVIYTINTNGQPDAPLGHAPVKDGDNKNVMVQIDPSKVAGPLYAMLHVDQGVVGKFEFPGPDGPIMMGVQMIVGRFTITGAAANGSKNSTESTTPQKNTQTPAIIVANQPIVNKAIILPEVISVGEEWVVIHKQNGDGSMGEMAGFAPVHDGVNKNVVVPLDTSLTSSVMYAMLHQNNSKKSSPQFPGVDGPVMVNGQMVAPTFEITTASNADVVINLGDTPATVSYLVDGHQMSLYISLNDSPGKSNCSRDCLALWHPLYATGRIIAGTGVQQDRLGVVLLPDGSRQVSYLGSPLYLYSKDEKPGDVNGQGLDGIWYLITP
jgi:predicted lipoprotein with Yx(FWY)xxD motif